MASTLVRAGWVISMDEALGDIRDGEIYITDGMIAAVGHKLEVATDEIIDAPNMIALPGLINSHMHTWQVGLRGLGFDWAGPDYYRNIHGNLATRYQPRDNYLANLIGALNQIDNGVTTLFDWCHNLRDLEMAEASVEGLKASRIRAVFGHGTAKPSPVKGGDAPHARVPHPRERVAALRKGLLSSDDGLITMALCILGPDQSPPEITSHDFKLAREFGLISSAHVYARPDRRIQRHGYKELAGAGLLGPDHNIVHGNYLSDEELEFLVDYGVTFSATVMLETQFDAPVPLTARVPQLGAMPALGIDVEPIVSGDMFNEMRSAMIATRWHSQTTNQAAGGPALEHPVVTTRDVLRWATIGGARAVGLEHRVGSLTPGKRADVILMRADSLDFVPLLDPVRMVVTCGSGELIDTVLIDGEIRKRGGVLAWPKASLDKNVAELLQSAARIRREAGLEVEPLAA